MVNVTDSCGVASSASLVSSAVGTVSCCSPISSESDTVSSEPESSELASTVSDTVEFASDAAFDSAEDGTSSVELDESDACVLSFVDDASEDAAVSLLVSLSVTSTASPGFTYTSGFSVAVEIVDDVSSSAYVNTGAAHCAAITPAITALAIRCHVFFRIAFSPFV